MPKHTPDQSKYTHYEVLAMLPSARITEGDELWDKDGPRPYAPEAEPEKQDFQEKVGMRILELLGRLEKIPEDERDEYLRYQRQVAYERAEMDLMARSDIGVVTRRKVDDAAYENADYAAAIQASAGRASDVLDGIPVDSGSRS